MSPNMLIAYKNIGETPLECLERVRKEGNIDKDIPMTYAGRLDPMAKGLMILLVGEECKNKDKYLGLDKTYEFQILVGFSTDTYDLLGLVNPEYTNSSHLNFLYGGSDTDSDFIYSEVENTLNKFIGTFTQKYPPFSSKTVGGKQLFQLSKDDELPEGLPEHEVTIYKLSCTNTEVYDKDKLQKEIFRKVDLVKGDFRQREIIDNWNSILNNTDKKEFEIISCICECSSGTYIRQLVADISKEVGAPMVTYSINRTKVGQYSIDDKS